MAESATVLFLDGKLLFEESYSLQPGRNTQGCAESWAAPGFPPLRNDGGWVDPSRLTNKGSFALGAERGKSRFPDGSGECCTSLSPFDMKAGGEGSVPQSRTEEKLSWRVDAGASTEPVGRAQ